MRADRRHALAAAALVTATFLPTALACGLYLDDYSFLHMLEGVTAGQLWDAFIRYVPGRNLHIPFFALLLRFTGSSTVLLHLVSVAFDVLLAALSYHLAARLTGSRRAALLTAAVFILMPNHGETHFWITLIPQCQIPMALALGAFLLAARPTPRLALAVAVFAAALFTYDQVFLLWPLLLFVAWRSQARPRPASYVAAAATLCVLDAAHLAVRYLSPYASGGRPLIRFNDVLARSRDAVYAAAKGLVPWPTTSHAHWAWTVLAVIGAFAALRWLAAELRRETAREEAPADWRLPAAIGAAWTALAYGPNLFWYLSPRHNLIPSFGLSLAAAVAALEAWRRFPRARKALAATGGVAFVLAVVSNVHEGTQWADSGRLKESFAAEVRRLARPLDAVFLLDAPRYLRRAPAFNLYHDVVFAAARAVNEGVATGDYCPVPTRAGIAYFTDLSVWPADALQWTPAARSSLIAYDPATRSFACAARLRLVLPDGSTGTLPLRPDPACVAEPQAVLDAALLSSRPGAAARAPVGAPAAGGLSLVDASLEPAPGLTVLALRWIVGRERAPRLALVPRVLDEAGRPLLDSVFPRRAGRRSFPVLWPLVDESAPDAAPGAELTQRFALKRALADGDVPRRLELAVYTLEPGKPAAFLGLVTAPISVRKRP